MLTKVLAFLAIAATANGNDVIVGLKTNGTKFFDENRQANPALWRQMDNVTIKAPENEVISRVVITDLRPDKDGDAKVVEGGEGQKNVTVELKSPTVLRGYEFHIEVYSTPEENVPFTNDQKSTTDSVQDGSTAATSTNPTTNLDTTSKLPDLSTDKIVPAGLSTEEDKDNERQGRNAKHEQKNAGEVSTESTSTTFINDISTVPSTQNTESVTENRSEKSDIQNDFKHKSTISPVPLNDNFNNNPALPALSGKEAVNDQINVKGNSEIRHVRDTEKENSDKPTESNVSVKDIFFTSTENDKEATTTEISDAIPVEEKSEDNDKEDQFNTFNNRKYTSAISSNVEQPHNPIEAKDSEKLRNVRGANEQMIDGTTIIPEDTTTDMNAETTTLSGEDCVTTEATSVQNPDNRDNVNKPDPIPVYINNRQWNERFNNPTFSRDGQNAPGLKLYPAILTNDQQTSEATNLSPDQKP